MNTITKAFLAAACAAQLGWAQEKVYVPFFEMINVHPDYQYSTARLFKSYVDEAGKYELVIPGRADSISRQPAPDSIRNTAKSLGCAYYLIGDMNRIGETVIFSLSMYQSGDGKRTWSDKLKASGPEDLDPIFQKLARALGRTEKAAADGDIFSVTSYEGRELRQVKVRNSFGVAVGGTFFTPGMLFGNAWKEPFVGGGAVFWAYDSRTILFEVDAETYPTAQNSLLTSFSISAFKPFAMGRVTPFGGGGLGIGRAETEYQGQITEGTGLFFHGGGGMLFNRTSTVQLRIQARYVVGAFEMSAPYNEIPRAVLIRMELAFSR